MKIWSMLGMVFRYTYLEIHTLHIYGERRRQIGSMDHAVLR